MFMGLTIASVLGVPLATWAGQHFGCRVSFWGIVGLGVLTMVSLRLTLPRLPAPQNGSALAELRVLTGGTVLAALALTVVGSSAMFTVCTYIVPTVREMTHASLGFVTAMLVTRRRQRWPDGSDVCYSIWAKVVSARRFALEK